MFFVALFSAICAGFLLYLLCESVWQNGLGEHAGERLSELCLVAGLLSTLVVAIYVMHGML